MFELSEDDIRTKVVYTWLKGCGLSDIDIAVEYTIPLRLGHGMKTLISRTDVLVRRKNGNSLLIIEVKKPSHELVDEDKWQAISYGRSLASGGIPPFTILTNGDDTRIYDTVTAEFISNDRVDPDNRIVTNNFQVTGDGIKARSEALQYLLSLSAGNLLEFCKGQVKNRIQLLKGEDITSGKKYIPSLYVERELARQQLEQRISGPKKREITLIVGPPQHGKTCFVCASVEHYLDQGVPCLLYPAIGLQGSLLDAIAEDFEWATTEALNHAQVTRRISSLLESTGQQLLLFIDGWNEMLGHSVALNMECSRLSEKKIQIILSTTSTSIPRLLKDSADNIDYIAGKLGLNETQISRLAKESLTNTAETGLVQIGKFNSWELGKATDLHEQHFNVKFAKYSNLPEDPFYLRLAAESYKNGEVPDFATRASLIHDSIIRKGRRRNIDQQKLFIGLQQIIKPVFDKDVPIKCIDLPTSIAAGNVLDSWLESAILLQTENDQKLPVYDFYYTHDRDYCIALFRGWLEGFSSIEPHDREQEVKLAIKTEAGKSALQWLLSCPEYVNDIELLFEVIHNDTETDLVLRQLLADAIFSQYRFHGNKDFKWLEKHLVHLLADKKEGEESDGPAQLVFAYILSIDRETNYPEYKFWMRVLLKFEAIENISFSQSYVYKSYEEIFSYSRDGYGEDSTFDLELFKSFLYEDDDKIAERAALSIAATARNLFLKEIPALASHRTEKGLGELHEIVGKACEDILGNLQDNYYGGMCPGWLTDRLKYDSLYYDDDGEQEDDEIYYEFIEQRDLWLPVLQCVSFPTETVNIILGILADLKKCSGKFPDGTSTKPEEPIIYNPNQLKLDL